MENACIYCVRGALYKLCIAYLYNNIILQAECVEGFRTVVAEQCADGQVDVKSLAFLRSIVEIFYTMGVAAHKDFQRIQSFVDRDMVNRRGRFVVKKNMELVTSPFKPNESLDCDECQQVYKTLDDIFMGICKKYYTDKQQRWANECTLVEYLHNVNQFRESEHHRIGSYMVLCCTMMFVQCCLCHVHMCTLE